MPVIERSSISNVADLIQLPRFDAAGAVAVGEALVAVAAEVPELPRSIQRAKEALEEDLAALRSAAAARLAAAAAVDPTATATADRSLDACWTALHDWLAAFAKLPDGIPVQAEAIALLTELFPDGLSFILLPYEGEWEQSERRLAQLAAGSATGDRIRALGGAVLVDALLTAHTTYGKALGLPRPRGPSAGGAPSVAAALETFTATLRLYAVKVTGYVEIDDPKTAELATTLLAPLLHYQVRYSR